MLVSQRTFPFGKKNKKTHAVISIANVSLLEGRPNLHSKNP